MGKSKKLIEKTKKISKRVTNELGLITENSPSRFESSLGMFYLKFLGFFAMSVLSVGILLPYAYYLYSKDKYKNVYIDNKKIVFTGRIEDAYFTFIGGYILLSLIIMGFNYATTYILPLIKIDNETAKTWVDSLITTLVNALPTILVTSLLIFRLYKWQQQNIHIISRLDEPSYFETHIVRALVGAILRKLLSFFSFGLGNPASIYFREKFLCDRQFCSELKLNFKGNILSSYSWFLWRYYLNIVSFGIYYPIYLYRYINWTIMNAHIDPNQEHLTHKINFF